MLARLTQQPLVDLLVMQDDELAWWMAQTAEAVEKYPAAFGLMASDDA